MPDYQKAKIYKLWSPQGTEEEVYFGSTTDELRKRKNQHKSKNHNCKSKILFEKYDDVRIELVEEYPCNSKAELFKKEGEYIKNNKCLNRNVAGRTHKEYCEDNKESIKEYLHHYQKEYQFKNYEKNKEKISERKKKYYKDNKEKILERIKKYNELFVKNLYIKEKEEKEKEKKEESIFRNLLN